MSDIAKNDAEKPATPEAPRRRSWFAILPLVAFLALGALFYFRLGAGDPNQLPSALIGRPAPQTSLPPLEGLNAAGANVPGIQSSDFNGSVTLVNVFASWCIPCAEEAPLFVQLAKDKRVRVVGINYKDAPDNARRFLGRYGNPYQAVGVDASGRTAIEWGVYGVPETFIVGKDGKIAYKLVGPLTPDNIDSIMRVQIEKALKAGA
ncbi:MAG: DsbE family thiol:disulfide interchange protein [Hyphomicrobiales bacterium]|nr:DsbE family thiol:disulfide interchange protein [Hyphomicrobiales bacterium]